MVLTHKIFSSPASANLNSQSSLQSLTIPASSLTTAQASIVPSMPAILTRTTGSMHISEAIHGSLLLRSRLIVLFSSTRLLDAFGPKDKRLADVSSAALEQLSAASTHTLVVI